MIEHFVEIKRGADYETHRGPISLEQAKLYAKDLASCGIAGRIIKLGAHGVAIVLEWPAATNECAAVPLLASKIDMPNVLKQVIDNLGAALVKMHDVPCSAESHVEQAVRLLAQLTDYVPDDAEAAQAIKDAIAQGDKSRLTEACSE